MRGAIRRLLVPVAGAFALLGLLVVPAHAGGTETGGGSDDSSAGPAGQLASTADNQAGDVETILSGVTAKLWRNP
ncbi:hypothetical protein ACQEVS_02570 [Streptomyces sp. CA-181903]|uniref:hypothetical protein n=1 Tax=Streptomyces sp. CA-181903 TaxID=3240055 RepID=UPI003D90AD22